MLALGVLACLGTIGIGLAAVVVEIEQHGWGVYLMLIGITGLMLCTIVCVMGVDKEHHRSKRRRRRLQMENEHVRACFVKRALLAKETIRAGDGGRQKIDPEAENRCDSRGAHCGKCERSSRYAVDQQHSRGASLQSGTGEF